MAAHRAGMRVYCVPDIQALSPEVEALAACYVMEEVTSYLTDHPQITAQAQPVRGGAGFSR